MISFSGIDCCGKSTQIDLLCKDLEKQGKKYQVIWSRGGYTPGIERVKKLLRGGSSASKEEKISYSEQVNSNSKKRKLLFVASLMDLWFYYSVSLRLKEWFGTTVICDRYIWDTYIDFKIKYPDYDFERGFWWRLTLKTMLKPKASFCMFISAEESMRRSSLKEEPFPESVEARRERIDWYVRERENNRWQYVIDATKSIEEVYSAIVERL